MRACPLRRGIRGWTNLRTTSLAAPQAASSSLSRYSRTERCVVASSCQSTSSVLATERCLLASAAIKLAVDGEAFTTDQALSYRAPHHDLKHSTESVTFTGTTVPALWEGRVLGNAALQSRSTEPAICTVEVNLVAKRAPSERQSSSPRPACGSLAPDRSREALSCCRKALIPSPIDQNRCAQSRNRIDMIV
jgi:hypothetical protein